MWMASTAVSLYLSSRPILALLILWAHYVIGVLTMFHILSLSQYLLSATDPTAPYKCMWLVWSVYTLTCIDLHQGKPSIKSFWPRSQPLGGRKPAAILLITVNITGISSIPTKEM